MKRFTSHLQVVNIAVNPSKCSMVELYVDNYSNWHKHYDFAETVCNLFKTQVEIIYRDKRLNRHICLLVKVW